MCNHPQECQPIRTPKESPKVKIRRNGFIKIPRILPVDFETSERVEVLASKLHKGLEEPEARKKLGVDEILKLKECKTGNRCQSGLCPICHRLFRRKALRFFKVAGFHQHQWVLATVRQKRWEMKGGDKISFAKFNGHNNSDDITDIPELRNLIQCLRRKHKSLGRSEKLVIIACVETTYQIVANRIVTLPFHFHLMISGLSKIEIEEASRKLRKGLGPSVSGMPRAIDIQSVGNNRREIIDSLSYVLKQPFWKISKSTSDVKRGKKQTPNAQQLAELAYCFGPLECTGRFTFVGLKYHGGKLRLSK